MTKMKPSSPSKSLKLITLMSLEYPPLSISPTTQQSSWTTPWTPLSPIWTTFRFLAQINLTNKGLILKLCLTTKTTSIQSTFQILLTLRTTLKRISTSKALWSWAHPYKMDLIWIAPRSMIKTTRPSSLKRCSPMTIWWGSGSKGIWIWTQGLINTNICTENPTILGLISLLLDRRLRLSIVLLRKWRNLRRIKLWRLSKKIRLKLSKRNFWFSKKTRTSWIKRSLRRK